MSKIQENLKLLYKHHKYELSFESKKIKHNNKLDKKSTKAKNIG